MDSKPGAANAGTKVAGSLERYAADAQFAEKTQADVGTKSLEEIRTAYVDWVPSISRRGRNRVVR